MQTSHVFITMFDCWHYSFREHLNARLEAMTLQIILHHLCETPIIWRARGQQQYLQWLCSPIIAIMVSLVEFHTFIAMMVGRIKLLQVQVSQSTVSMENRDVFGFLGTLEGLVVLVNGLFVMSLTKQKVPFFFEITIRVLHKHIHLIRCL